MRCIWRNAGAFLAMIWSGAAAALAGPVSIRTALDYFDPDAIVRADWRSLGDVEPLTDLAAHVGAVRQQWFPDGLALAAPPVPPVPIAVAEVRPAAVVIPLAAPVWLGLAGLGCALFAARVIDPYGGGGSGRRRRALQ